MSSSAPSAQRKQFANSMPGPTRRASRGATAQDATTAAPLGSSAAFSATGSPPVQLGASKTGPTPHRPAAAPTKNSRAAQQQQQHRRDPKAPSGTGRAETQTKANPASSLSAAAANNNNATTMRSTAVRADGAMAATLPYSATDASSTVSFPFDVYPPMVVFDGYTANTTYTASFELKNRTAVNRHVRVDRPDACTGFELTAPRGAESSSKVAPGLSVTYTVVFTPASSAKDYEVDLVVRTEDDEPILVPVRAYASRGCLQLPAALTLKSAPMKSTSTTSLFLRNTSERACVWRAVVYDVADAAVPAGASLEGCPLSSCFAVTPHNGTVAPLCPKEGQSLTVAPVTLRFSPDPAMPAAGACRGLLRFFLGPEGDVVQDVQLSAQAIELGGIALEDAAVTLADTYVTTERQAVVRVRNDSDETIQFSWKNAFRSDEAPREQSRQLGGLGDSDSSSRGSLDDALPELFEGGESFQIQPLSGVLYSRGVREFTVTFNPRLAIPYESVAFLDVTGLARRLPLVMRGHGVGPQVKLEFSRLDIGDVYLNAVHEYTVVMENTSAIECQFVIMPPSTAAATSAAPLVDFASKFRFTPSHGSLAPGASVKLHIELNSDRTGSFAEEFHVHMQGAVEEVPLLLKGRVLGPHFRCDVDELDFGNVSYNMTHRRAMSIENTSPIPMHYTLHLPDDCAYADDFTITPAEGVIAPYTTEAVQVHFCSRTVGDYDTALLVEVADVGDVLDAIPLKATCMVPTLHSSTTELTYGGVFVGYPTTLNVAVNNDTALTGMFELQLLGGDALADVVMVELPLSTEHDDGVHWIAPRETLQLPVTLTALRPGRLHFSLALHVLGREVQEPTAPPLTILVSAVASGPHVELQPTSLQFGTLDVLTESVKELTLKNTSPVPAPFALLFDRFGSLQPTAKTSRSGSGDGALAGEEAAPLPFPRVPVFTVEPAEGVLEPHSAVTVRVRAKPDDAMTFADTLRLRRALPAALDGDAHDDGSGDGDSQLESDVSVSVKVVGRGVPIIANRPLESVDIGDVLTNVPVVETITMHNYGHRDQEVQWQNTRGSKVKEGEPPITFAYKPERASIAAGGSAVFQLCGSSAEVGQRVDTFQLKQTGTFAEVLRSTVTASFIAPTLSCSTRSITFEYANTPTSPAAPSLVKSLTMKNTTSKTLVVFLRIKGDGAVRESPFGLESPATITLPSGESYVVGVRCNPLYRGDYTTHTVKAKLQLSFAEHDRKEFVSLTAALQFPSIVMQPPGAVDFGTVLTDTEQRRSIELHNPSAHLPAIFHWTLRPPADSSSAAAAVATRDDGGAGAAEKRVSMTSSSSAAAAQQAQRVSSAGPMAKVNGFDVIPFSGTLLPGEKKVVEIAFQGKAATHALATAVCHIAGGPTYTVELRAAANVVHAQCDKSSIDFGHLPYYESASKVVTLTNTTQVHVPWHVDLSGVRNAASLKVSPMSGLLRDKARLQVTFSPKVPDVFEETIWVRVGHLDPQPIHVRGSGYMCSVAIVTTTTAAELAQRTGVGNTAGKEAAAVQVYRAPFPAFDAALRDVAAAPPEGTVAELPACLQGEWATLEAERRAFCRAVREHAAGVPRGTDSAAVAGDEEPADSSAFLAPRNMRRTSATAQRSSGSATTKLSLSRYVVDFGHLTRYDVRKATLTVANPSAEGVSVVLDSKEFADLPVSVDMTKGFKVAARDTATIEVTMDATKPESVVPHGANVHEFTLDIKNGPAVVVECRCYVATPALKAAEREVAFGDVLLGEVKVLPLVLTNPEAVACPWRVTCKDAAAVKPPAPTAGRASQATAAAETDEDAIAEFWVKQDRGVVPAQGSVTLEVYYAPKSYRTATTTTSGETAVVLSTGSLKFRCGSGPASTTLAVKLSGAARHYDVGLSACELQLPPSRPHQVLQEAVTLTNNEDFAIEVYSVALDPQHADEVKLLRRALEVSPGHELLLPHIHAGESLPDSLLETIFASVHGRSEALVEVVEEPAEAVDAVERTEVQSAGKGGGKVRGSGSASSGKGGAKPTQKETRRASAKPAAAAAAAQASATAAGADSGDGAAGEAGRGVKASVVLLVGPPRSGKTSLAQRWAEADASAGVRTVLVDVDALIRAEAERDDTAHSAVARCLLTRAAEMAAAAADAPSAAADAVEGTAGGADSSVLCTPVLIRDLLQSLLQRSMAAVKASAAAQTADKDGKPTDSVTPTPSIRFVVDGLTCGVVADQWLLYELISEVCAAVKVPLVVVSLELSTPMSNVRAARALEREHEARVAASAVAPLEEAAYESFSRAEREDYNCRLKHMNDCRRDLQAAQREVERWTAQLPHASLQAELEEALAPAPQAAPALDATTGSAKSAKASAARLASDGAAKDAGEPDWAALDATAQFCAWYRRFLKTFGCPPKQGEDEGGAAAPAAAAAAAAAAGRAPANAKGGAGAAAAAGAPVKDAWSKVLRVSAEAQQPAELAQGVLQQLAQREAEGTSGNAGTDGPLSPTAAAAAGGGESASQAASKTASPAGTPESDSANGAVSQLGEWYYMNEARLRYWTGGQRSGSRLTSATASTHLVENAGAENGARAAAGQEAAAATEQHGSHSELMSGTAHVIDSSGRHVHFFATVEREVVSAKKPAGKKKSVASMVMQKEDVTRWMVPAHASVTLSFEFSSDQVGKFAERCVFGVVGTSQQLCLTVAAAVALPDIRRDPKDIFPVVKARGGGGGGGNGAAAAGRRVPKVYITSKKLFDFGALLIAPAPAVKGRRRSGGGNSSTTASPVSAAAALPGASSFDDVGGADSAGHNGPCEETLSFVNREPAVAEVTLTFANDKEKIFTVSPTSFTLQPGATQLVQLRASPDRAGDFTNTLVATIKDNPVPWKADLLCTGARPTLTINGVKDALDADFGRLVLRRTLTKTFTLANDGALPLYWRLVPVPESGGRGGGGGMNSSLSIAGHPGTGWPPELQCNVLEGVLEEKEVQAVDLTFAPTHPCLHSRAVNFIVTEVGQPQTTYETIPMTIKAEGYDVVVEWTRELHLGVLHVGEEKRETIRIMNKSPYDIGYQLRMPKRLQKVLTLTPPSGTLRGMMGFKDAAIATVDVVARLDKEGELPAKLSVIEAAFFDVDKQELLYPLQSIPISGEAWYTKYTVHPPSVAFGSCMVGQLREGKFEITNTGRFPMEYTLFNYRDTNATAVGKATAGTGSALGDAAAAAAAAGSGVFAAPATSGGGDAAPAQRKSIKSLKGNEADFVLGAFTCSPCHGVVPVGGSQLITVSTIPSQQNRTHETVGVRVAQSGAELERYGTPVELSAYPAAPSIAADLSSSADVETIFEEQRVVYRLDQLPQGVPAYSREERVFSFGTCLVGQRCEERFRIANSSPLMCTVSVQLEGSAVAGGGGAGGSAGAGNGRKSVANNNNNNNNNAGGGGADASKSDGFDIVLDSRSAAAAGGGGGGAAPGAKASMVRFTLPPFESRFVRVGFTPNSLSRLQAQLVATVDAAATPGEERGEAGQLLRFGLCGEGTLPTVEVELPPRWASSEMDRARPSNSAVSDQLRSMEGSTSGADKKKSGRRRQGAGSMSSSSTTLHVENHPGVGAGGADVLEVPVTRVGAVSTRRFTIRNTGTVEAEVRLALVSAAPSGGKRGSSAIESITAGPPASLSLRLGSGELQQRQEELQVPVPAAACHSIEVVIAAGQAASIDVAYAPTQVESATARLRLALASNPFEDKDFSVVVRSFKSAISFEGIDPASCDFLDAGDCYVGVDKTCSFSVRNNTAALVRYTWDLPAMVRMVPSVGHLASGATRTFTAIVRSTTEGHSQRAHCALHAQAIVLQGGALGGGATGLGGAGAARQANTTAGAAAANRAGAAAPAAAAAGAVSQSEWDNSMQSPKWVLREDDADAHSSSAAAYLSAAAAMMGRRNLKQVMEAVPEPAYTVVEEEASVTQPLTVGYRCSTPLYHCQLFDVGDAAAAPMEATAIAFAQTYLLQKRVATLRITNTGSVVLPYSCGITAGGAEVNETSAGDKEEGSANTWTAAELSAAAAAAAGGEEGQAAELGSATTSAAAAAASDFSLSSASWASESAKPSDVHTVEAGGFADLAVAFTPRTVGLLTGQLLLRFPHSEPREMQIPLQGVAECPLVHFSIPPSAQPLPTTAAEAAESAAAAAPALVNVRLLARGLHSKATVRFPMVNPSAGSYTYEWVEESGGAGAAVGGVVSPFRCLTSSGVIAAGRSVEAAFEFFADAIGTRESSWQFRIPGRLTIPFRITGTTVEPRVYLHASRVNFDHVQVGTRVERTVVLENAEDVPFPFAWDKASLEGTASFLSVKPLRGTVAPHERLPISLVFAPQEETEHNVPLRCAVKKASAPLTLNVKGVGISVHDALQIEPVAEAATEDVITVLRGQPCVLDLGRVQVQGSAARRFVLRNTGAHAFHYTVDTPSTPSVTLDGGAGTVEAGQSAVMTLHYRPTAEETLRQCRLLVRIEGGAAYKVSVRAVAYLPRLHMSADRVNFGPRFIAAYSSALATSLSTAAAAADMPAELAEDPAGVVTQELTLTNTEAEAVTVECAMDGQSPWCALDCTSLVVRPRETARLTLTFTPAEARLYEDTLRLSFNGVHTVLVPVAGEGVVPRVEVATPFAKLGSVRVGESRAVEVRLHCHSKIPTPVSFARTIDEELRSKGLAVLLPGQQQAASSSLLSTVLLKPKEVASISVLFAPTHRMSEFTRELKMLVSGVELPFVSISGSSADAEVHLDTTHLAFHDVVVGGSATRKVVLLNSGDVAQRFSWLGSLQALKPAGELSITPSSGHVRAHTEITCEVRFTPSPPLAKKRRGGGASPPPVASPPAAPAAAMRLLRVEFDSAPALALSVETSAVARPPPSETVPFACRARETDTRTIEVENTTDQLWTAEPVIDNGVWACPSHIAMKPRAKTTVSVTYSPMRSTLATAAAPAVVAAAPASSDAHDKPRLSTVTAATAAAAPPPLHQKDKGLLYIPLPDGTGRCVALEGTAEAPGPSAPLQRHSGVAQTALPLRFVVHNWSTAKIARFRREVEWTSGPGIGSDSTDAAGGQPTMRVHDGDSDASSGRKKGAASSSAAPAAAAAGGAKRSGGGTARSPSPAAVAAVRETVDVPARASKEVTVTVTPMRDGVYRGVVRFQPVDKTGAALLGDGMLQFYELEITVQPPPAAAPTLVDLRAGIRELATFNIPLTNPLTKPVEFVLKAGPVDGAAGGASVQEGLTVPTSVTVPPQSHGKAAVTYFPLLFKKTPATVQCSVSSAELGVGDVYRLRLITTSEAPPAERVSQVTCPLGQQAAFSLRFTHYARVNTEFAVRVNGEVLGKTQTSFSRAGNQGPSVKVSAVPPPTTSSPSNAGHGGAALAGPKGQEVVAEFLYEPSELGEERATIEFVSAVAGTYTFPVVATCTAPQRQGPFSTRAGQNLQLPFKNVFHEPVTITVTADSAAFVPAKKTETVPAHKSTSVVLQCKADEDKEVTRGRVFISCPHPGKGVGHTVEWVYYVELTAAGDRPGTGKQSARKK